MARMPLALNEPPATPGASDGRPYDIAIIGGGINGCAIARDAAGRGWRVHLCDRADLGAGTSSASTKLIHGGLRYLENHEFRLVREALMEREVLWSIAPHIVRPLRFVLPHRRGLRPAWLLRLGLFIYDHLGGRRHLPPSRTVRLHADPAGADLKPEFALGFEYSDCWVDDARLVILNARDAADRGATIAPRTSCVSAQRDGGLWHLDLRDETTCERRTILARALINATGPWVAQVAQSVIGAPVAGSARLVKGSHIVVPRLYDHAACYIFQNDDGRIVFVIPFERDFTLIGTTDEDFAGDPTGVQASAAEIDYLCRATGFYLRRPITPQMVLWSFAGVRPLFDGGSAAPQQARRDYVLKLDAPPQQAALLTVFGGKITTCRRLAEATLAMLRPYLPAARGLAPGWTGHESLPGGDFPVDGFEAQLRAAARHFPFLPNATLRRLLRAYGTRAYAWLGGAKSADDLGRAFGADLTEAELRYLVRAEWARTAEDVVWRRSKLGLRLSPHEIAAVDTAVRRIVREGTAAVPGGNNMH